MYEQLKELVTQYERLITDERIDKSLGGDGYDEKIAAENTLNSIFDIIKKST